MSRFHVEQKSFEEREIVKRRWEALPEPGSEFPSQADGGGKGEEKKEVI